MSELEHQFVEEKAAKETLLTSMERVLSGEAVDEKDFELKLVRLIQDIKVKVFWS